MSTTSSHVTQGQGQGGLSLVTIQHPTASATAQVYLHGAHVTSFNTNGQEHLFVSKQAVYNGSKAIRGGVPLCWPQFGPRGDLPQHGFARNTTWSLTRSAVVDGGVSATFTLPFDAAPEPWNSKDLRVEYTVTVYEQELHLSLQVANQGKSEVQFTTALHTYFNIGDISQVGVQGLKGVTYIDQLQQGKDVVETSDLVTFTQETDRIYKSLPGDTVIQVAGKGQYSLRTAGLPDAVVWNPWTDKAQRMGDFGDEEYHNMVCVESAAIVPPVTVAPDGQWVGTLVVQVMS